MDRQRSISILFGGWAGAASLVLLTVLLLLLIGLVFVHSAADNMASSFPGPYAQSQLKKVILGLVTMLGISCLSPRTIERVAPIFFGATVALLVGLLLYKLAVGGVVRWIRLPGFQFQPSEMVKISTVLMMATLLRGGLRQSRWKHVLSILGCAALPFLLIVAQPDVGTAMILVPTVIAMVWVAQLSKRRLSLLALCTVLLATGAWYSPLVKSYHKERILSYAGFEDVEQVDQILATFVQQSEEGSEEGSGKPDEVLTDQEKTQVERIKKYLGLSEVNSIRLGSYQIDQSIIALASGGPTGKGLHMGRHHDLGYLPEDHNDFIFAVIGEEWGLQGTLLVLAIFLLLGFTLLGLAWSTRDHFGRLVVVGIATLLITQSLVNMAVVIELLPVTGLTLPFISYGGTSIVVSLWGVGVVLSIARHPMVVTHPDGLKKGSSPFRSRLIH
ncbi:MAG: FtsW/RodA/SpoVE family cell cycle protein [Planctomycetota bacterium]